MSSPDNRNIFIDPRLVSLFDSPRKTPRDRALIIDETIAIDSINDAAWELRMEDPARALSMAEEAFLHAQRYTYEKGMADALKTLSICKYLNSEFQEARGDATEALSQYEVINDLAGQATSLNTLGSISQSLGDYANALEFYTRSLRLRRELKDTAGEAVSLNNLGTVHSKLGDHQVALDYYFQSLDLKRQLKDTVGTGVALSNIGNIYQLLGDSANALEYHLQSLSLTRSIQDRRGEATALLNIGSFYHTLGDLEKAISYHVESLDILQFLGDKETAALCLCNIGVILSSSTKESSTALDYLKSALALALEIDSKAQIHDIYKALADVYEAQGDYKNALFHYKAYHQYKEDVFSEETAQRLKNLQVTLETERVEKEKEIYRLKNDVLKAEQEKSERLLLNVLPVSIAERLKRGEYVIADSFSDATILFADIVGFTELSTHLSAERVVDLLNKIFSTFDDLLDKYGLEKIKTIGDAYMVAGGVPVPKSENIRDVALFAIEILQAIKEIGHVAEVPISVRIGINVGTVVAGVIGSKKFIYDLWGDAVNLASRMESHSLEGKIQVTPEVYERLHQDFVFEPRGTVEIKGKGKMQTYFLLRPREKK